MKIIIVGTGTVGSAICTELAEEGHTITAIDHNRKTLDDLSNSCDIGALLGNGADISLLREAGAEKADLLIAVTAQDEVNILCCLAAKKLGTKNTVARVRNPEYSELTALTQDEMGLSFTINPEYAAAREISRVLKLPTASKIDTFCHGRVETVEFKVSENSMLVGKSLHELRGELDSNFLVCGIRRKDSCFIPLGSTVIEQGDVIAVTASDDNTSKFFKEIKSYKRPVKKVIIFGGGRITYYLGELLRKSKTQVTVIEENEALCQELAEQYNWTVINGNGTKQELLLEEGIENADAFLALSSLDEENAITSMFAKTKGVPKIVTMIGSLPYIDFFRSVGLESVVSPKYSTASQILRFVRAKADSRASEILALHRLMDGKIEALEFAIKENINGLTGIPIRNIKRKDDTLIACIVRNDEIIIPSGDDEILPADRVIIVTMIQNVDSIKDVLR